MDVVSLIASIFKPAVDLVDELHTSDEERGVLENEAARIKNVLMQAQNQITGKFLDYETKLMEAQSSIIKAEATGQSWLQRNWRPLAMITFLVLIVFDAFGVLALCQRRLGIGPERLVDDAWGLLKLGMGGYIVGRSAEKIVPSVVDALGKKG